MPYRDSQTMPTLHPDPNVSYVNQQRLPGPNDIYPQQGQYRQPNQQQYPAPAPRQRTAIACRYCRRRKVERPRPYLSFARPESR